MARLAVLSFALLAALPACKDAPSFRLRWELVDRPDPADPDADPVVFDVTRSFHCSQLGVSAVRVRVIDELGDIAHEDVHACFAEGFDDPDRLVDGPELRAGLYALEVRGVQRDLKEWFGTPDPTADVTECVPEGDKPLGCKREDRVCDCNELEVVEDETFSDFDLFRLEAPRDCVDGVDNDVDGLVDRQDPGCSGAEAVDGDCGDGIDNDGDGNVDDFDDGCLGSEATDVTRVQFTMRVTLFDENPGATCTGVGLSRVHVIATPPAGEAIEVAVLECRVGDTLFFSAELPESDGPFALEVEGRNAAGEAITAKQLLEETVEPSSNAIVDLDVNFNAEDFTPAIVTSSSFLLDFADHPDSALACDGEPAPLFVPQLSLRLLDLAGAPVTDATLRQGEPLDGTPLACTHQVLVTEDLTWGGYRLAAEALASDGTVCFRTDADGELLAPGASIAIELDPVLEAGALPAACFACDGVAGCS